MVKVIELIDLTKSQLDKLNRNKTIFVSAISPIEVHGPHLPLGSDLMAAREIMKRTCQKIKNLNELKEFNFYGVDVSSVIEAQKGKNDKQKMINFCKLVG